MYLRAACYFCIQKEEFRCVTIPVYGAKALPALFLPPLSLSHPSMGKYPHRWRGQGRPSNTSTGSPAKGPWMLGY